MGQPIEGSNPSLSATPADAAARLQRAAGRSQSAHAAHGGRPERRCRRRRGGPGGDRAVPGPARRRRRRGPASCSPPSIPSTRPWCARCATAFPGIRLIGSSSSAEMSSVVGYREDSVILAVFASDTVGFTTAAATWEPGGVEEACRRAVRRVLAATDQPPRLCIMVADALDGQLALEAVRRALPDEAVLVGGGSSGVTLGAPTPVLPGLRRPGHRARAGPPPPVRAAGVLGGRRDRAPAGRADRRRDPLGVRPHRRDRRASGDRLHRGLPRRGGPGHVRQPAGHQRGRRIRVVPAGPPGAGSGQRLACRSPGPCRWARRSS